eukprot:scaffold28762_cov38-Tisochrysis_lutea.AAC.3
MSGCRASARRRNAALHSSRLSPRRTPSTAQGLCRNCELVWSTRCAARCSRLLGSTRCAARTATKGRRHIDIAADRLFRGSASRFSS